ncbi:MULTISPECIES: tRNA (adenosine(37)-N6)-dimethylallyltransferase MiaA [Kocuria]|uniref:tRNA (adenosine(37)-N6)-dimethylallyltransferase MiaA n=1 Tax=Kocuria TaxID=57493 RepID=UPI0020189EFB|nr:MULTISPECIES: tRNA (adenosine(37)-N6)-dimethylallyltransferase MiaA [Kocuria]MCT1546149.1 tRNA (adenosine(37)-N6)-dimethylallyltransferase MiaA [Kocuria rhizophila]MCT2171739.1 tRNA (adenosine(37)-N6)-dimethylallyltransferase MiaA [Kocuria rhizophila]MDN3462264.1 tRNA (adenosine(37)-N6)-dimethylallyltransferase MiaA [Kocuria sp. APC 4018]WSQ05472.1 tRNA (adenosine(37)-N6)-dimethylallyltransferase MiaA [Kocuria rhizophila]
MADRGAPTPLVAVVGPTGTGKSDLGIALSHELGGEVINADALQLYRGMDIGTAKLPPEERDGVPHHLLDVLDIHEEASVAAFQRDARRCAEQIRERGRVPVLVGGSGLYVRAALDAIEFPGTDPVTRARREEQLRREGRSVLLRELARVDPESAARVKDDRRLVRALEVHDLTGRPFTSFMPQRRYVRPTVQIGLAMGRDELNDRLARRVDLMLERGWLDEVRALAARGLRESPTAGRALGYPQLLAVLDGTMTLAQAREDTVAATRRFTKRQRTWFRADPRVHWIECSAGRSVTDLAARALQVVRAQ